MPKIRSGPPPSLLPDREVEICQRFREIRLSIRYQQNEFAEELGISLERIKNYEYCRAPIQYGLGNRACELFNVNQRWLATGEEPVKPFLDPAPWIQMFVPYVLPFSFVYDRLLFDFFGPALAASSAAFTAPLTLEKEAFFEDAAETLKHQIKRTLDRLSPLEGTALIMKLIECLPLMDPRARKRLEKLTVALKAATEKPFETIVDKQRFVLEKLGLSFEEYRRLNRRSKDAVTERRAPKLS